MPETWYTTAEAAVYLHIPAGTIRCWRTRGGGPCYHKFGHAVRYAQSELDAWIALQVRLHTSDPGPLTVPLLRAVRARWRAADRPGP